MAFNDMVLFVPSGRVQDIDKAITQAEDILLVNSEVVATPGLFHRIGLHEHLALLPRHTGAKVKTIVDDEFDPDPHKVSNPFYRLIGRPEAKRA